MEKNKVSALMCRLCSSSHMVNNALIDLASDEINFAAEYRKIIFIMTGITIQVMDNVPSKVCRNCIKKALDNYNYRKTAQQNNMEYLKEHGQTINKDVKTESDSDNEVEFVSISVDMTKTTSTADATAHIPLKLRIDLKNLVCHNVGDKEDASQSESFTNTGGEPSQCHKSIEAIKTQHPTIALPPDSFHLNFNSVVLLDNSKVESYISTLVRQQRRRKYMPQTKDDVKLPKRMDVPIDAPPSERESKDLLLSSLGLLPIPEKAISSNVENVDVVNSTLGHSSTNNPGNTLDNSLLAVVKSYEVFMCKECNKVFRSSSGLRKHKRTLHSKCVVCLQRLLTVEEIKFHKCSSHLVKKPNELLIRLPRMELDESIRREWSKPFLHLMELIKNAKCPKVAAQNQDDENANVLSSATLLAEEPKNDNLIETEALTFPDSPVSVAGSQFDLDFSDEELNNDGMIKSALSITSDSQRQFLDEALFLKSSIKTPRFTRTVACTDIGTQADSIDLIFLNHSENDTEVVIKNLGSYFTTYNKVPIKLVKNCDKLKVTFSKIDPQKKKDPSDIFNQEPIALHVSKSKHKSKLKINLTNIISKRHRFELNHKVKNAVQFKNIKFQQQAICHDKSKSILGKKFSEHGNNSCIRVDKPTNDMEVLNLSVISNTPASVNISQYASSSSNEKSILEYVTDTRQPKVAQKITSTVIDLDSENEKENTGLETIEIVDKELNDTQEPERIDSTKSAPVTNTTCDTVPNSLVQYNIPILESNGGGGKDIQQESTSSLQTSQGRQFEQACTNRISNPNANCTPIVLNHSNSLLTRTWKSVASSSNVKVRTRILPHKIDNGPSRATQRRVYPSAFDKKDMMRDSHQLPRGTILNNTHISKRLPTQVSPGKHRNLPVIIQRPPNHSQINQPEVINNTIPLNLHIHQNVSVLQNQNCYINQHCAPDQTLYSKHGWMYGRSLPPLHYICSSSNSKDQLVSSASVPPNNYVQHPDQQYDNNSTTPLQNMHLERQVEHTPANFRINVQPQPPVSNVTPAIRVMKPWEINNKSFT